jgi:hypothetical protein
LAGIKERFFLLIVRAKQGNQAQQSKKTLELIPLNFKLLWKPYSGCSSFSLIKVSGLVIPFSTLAWYR